MATPLVWTAADGRIAGANPAFCRWLGVSVRRLLAQPLASLAATEVNSRLSDTPGMLTVKRSWACAGTCMQRATAAAASQGVREVNRVIPEHLVRVGPWSACKL